MNHKKLIVAIGCLDTGTSDERTEGFGCASRIGGLRAAGNPDFVELCLVVEWCACVKLLSELIVTSAVLAHCAFTTIAATPF
jgi:hypothetical protein